MANLPADIDYKIWWLIFRMNRAIYKVRAKELFKYGVTPQEVAVFFAVDMLGDRATPLQLAKYLVREPHSISSMLDRMEKKGLIEKVKDLGRRNLLRVRITRKGQQAYEYSKNIRSINTILSVIPEDDRDQLISYLTKILDKAEKELGKARLNRL